MNCPSCKNKLSRIYPGGIPTHTCKNGCGGFWIDQFHVRKIDDENASAGLKLLEVERAEGVRIFRDVEHVCPKCENTLLFRHFFNREWEVEVDQCGKCGGYWVDTGNFGCKISQNPSADLIGPMAEKFFSIMFEEKIPQMDLQSEHILRAARQIARIFLFICPTEVLEKNPEWRKLSVFY
ncbi:MAG: zf-TFIIB domain-containing protein [Nitrospinales bacterium]